MRTVAVNPSWATTIQLPDDGRQIGADAQIVGVRDPINPSVEATTHRVEYALANLEPLGHRSWRLHSVGSAATATQIVIESRVGLDQTGLAVSFPTTTVTLGGLSGSEQYVYVKRSDNSILIDNTKPDASGYYRSGGGGTDYWYAGSFLNSDATHAYSFTYADRRWTPFTDPFAWTVTSGATGWQTHLASAWISVARRVWLRVEFDNNGVSVDSAFVSAFNGSTVAQREFKAPAGKTVGGTACLVNGTNNGGNTFFNLAVGNVLRVTCESYEE